MSREDNNKHLPRQVTLTGFRCRDCKEAPIIDRKSTRVVASSQKPQRVEGMQST